MTVKVLVVDDSATMRSLVTTILRRDPEIEVVGAAGDPYEARNMIKQLNPDVITLDVEMPNMDGLNFLEKIMRLRPMPVIMVSTLTQRGSEVALQALELGAFDCVGKPTGSGLASSAFADLAEKVRAAARARVRPRQASAPVARHQGFIGNGRIVAIGSSTGGVEALLSVLSSFPENCPPTVITQHMPATFTASFAARLDRVCAPHVTEARDGDVLEGGRIYLAPGGDHHLEIAGSGTRRCRLTAGRPGQRAPPLGRRPVPFGGQGRGLPRRRRHPHGHGPRRRVRPARDEDARRPDHRPGRGHLRRLRHAARRPRDRRRRPSACAREDRSPDSRALFLRNHERRHMPAARSISVMTVDDQFSMRSLIRNGLREIGFQDVRECANGEEALRQLITQPVNLVISDFNMPKLDGIGLLRSIRAYPPLKNTAFIMLTGSTDTEVVKRAMQYGVNNYLVKPFTVAALRSRIEAVVGKLN